MRRRQKGPKFHGQAGFRQAGFSMVEMLMTAFILAIGILGLTMLQVMSLQASRGSRSMTTAVLVGEAVMDQVEMEARLSWLNVTDTNRNPLSTDLPTLRYITIPAAGNLRETFNLKGGAPNPSSVDPAEATPFFTVTTTRVPFPTVSTGNMSDITVSVQFADAVDGANVPIQRTVTLTRRVVHG